MKPAQFGEFTTCQERMVVVVGGSGATNLELMEGESEIVVGTLNPMWADGNWVALSSSSTAIFMVHKT